MPALIPTTITLNEQAYPLLTTRRKGTKRYVLRFNAKKQAVTLSMPMRASLKDGVKFVHKQVVWLENQILKSGSNVVLEPNVTVPILGVPVLLKHESGRGLASFSEQQLTIHGELDFFSRRLKDWLNKALKEKITTLAEEKAALLDVTFARIQIRDASTHWGSCSPSGTLSFTFRLVFATAEQIDYIVCHEVAHLREMNHSQRFWKLVSEICPDYQKHRRWFKAHGHELGRFVL